MAVATVADLLEHLRQSRLLDPSQLAELTPELLARCPDARALGRELLNRDWLTPYQVNALVMSGGRDLILGSYILLERLGEGGMGTVFKARHQKLGRIVALKLIRRERLAHPNAIRRFIREVRVAAQLSHPNVVLAFDADHVGDKHFLVMEYVEGIDLARRLKRAGPLPVNEACDYLRQAALGLQHAFERGLVHRDIKPANLMVTAQPTTSSGSNRSSADDLAPGGSVGLVKILDMGLARMMEPDNADSLSMLTPNGATMGTLDYLAPEQAMDSHNVDIRADLYSLGCTAYHLLAGRAPFAGGLATEKLLKHRLSEPPMLEQIRPEVPREVGDVVRRLMAKRPEDRFQTPAELAETLAELLGTGSALSAVGRRDDLAITLSPPSSLGSPEPATLTSPEGLPVPAIPVAIPLTESQETIASARHFQQVAEQQHWRRLLLGGGAVLAACLLLLGFFLWQNRRPAVAPPAPPSEVTVQVDANQSWLDTHMDLEPGQPVRLRVRGQWRKREQPPCSARGLAAAPRDRVVWPDAPPMALLARIGEDRPFPLTESQTLPVKTRGRLWLRVNDLDLADNSGSLSVVIDGGTWSDAAARMPLPLPPELAESGYKDLLARLADARSDREQLRTAVLEFAVKQAGTAQAMGALGLLARLPSPLDRIDGQLIPPLERAEAGGGDPIQAPAELVAVLGDSRWKHWATVVCVAFSADGKMLASGSQDGIIKVWETATGNPLHTVTAHDKSLRCLAFRNDGRMLASASNDGTVKLWDPATGKPLRTLSGHGASAVTSVAFSPDGQVLASASDDRMVKLWDPDTGKTLRTLTGHTNFAHCVAFQPGGAVLASVDYEGSVKLWETATGNLVRTLAAGGAVTSVAFSTDGALLAGGKVDGTVILWEPDTGKQLRTLAGHLEGVWAVAFRPDSKTLASRSEDGVLKLWDALTGEELCALTESRGRTYSVAFSPDGELLASAGAQGMVNPWRLPREWRMLDGKWYYIGPFDNTGNQGFETVYPPEKEIDLTKTYPGKDLVPASWKEFPGFRSGRIQDLARFPTNEAACVYLYHEIEAANAQEVPIALGSDDTLTVWFNGATLVKNKVSRQIGRDQDHAILKLRPGKNQLLVKVCNGIGRWEFYIGPWIKRLHAAAEPAQQFTAVALRTDGRRAATGSRDGTIKLWDLPACKELAVLTGHKGAVTSLAFSPDGESLASGSLDHSVKLWRVVTGLVQFTFAGHTKPVHSVAFHPDGQTVASGSADQLVKLWNAKTGQERLGLVGPPHEVLAVAFSPDGRQVAAGGKAHVVKIWETATGKDVLTLKGHSLPVGAVAFRGDGHLLADGSADGAVRLWNPANGERRDILRGPRGTIWSIAFNSEGSLLAVAGDDGRVRLWDPRNGVEKKSIRLGPEMGRVRQVVFSSDGRHLATVNGNGTVSFLRLAAAP